MLSNHGIAAAAHTFVTHHNSIVATASLRQHVRLAALWVKNGQRSLLAISNSDLHQTCRCACQPMSNNPRQRPLCSLCFQHIMASRQPVLCKQPLLLQSRMQAGRRRHVPRSVDHAWRLYLHCHHKQCHRRRMTTIKCCGLRGWGLDLSWCAIRESL